MTLQAIVFLAVAATAGWLVYRREGIGMGMTVGVAVLGALCLLSGIDPAPSADAPPTTPQQTTTQPSAPSSGA
ncbi:hypothetical protein AB0E77_28955 [Streptomyces sp. NPDC032940]|uniref:hypothetical protein n=1 Tax=Streptomyces sp. NPDC032940 TaxID=3155366 RepID=UPI0033E25D99